MYISNICQIPLLYHLTQPQNFKAIRDIKDNIAELIIIFLNKQNQNIKKLFGPKSCS